MTWQKLSSKKVYQNRYMSVTEDELITDHGDKVVFGIVRKEPFSVIIPWDGTRLLLVGQYRPSAEFFSWEFPMGHAESDTPLAAARKELAEETGLLAKNLVELATFYPALGTMDQLGYLYLATDWQVGKQDLETSEKGMQTRWVSLNELSAMIVGGTIKDGPTIAALKYFELYLSSQQSHE